MKYYVRRKNHEDFVCMADSPAAAIVMLWMVTRQTPEASYRVHEGRRCDARTVSSAICFWRLNTDLRAALCDVIKCTSTEKQYHKFCDTVIQIAELLGK